MRLHSRAHTHRRKGLDPDLFLLTNHLFFRSFLSGGWICAMPDSYPFCFPSLFALGRHTHVPFFDASFAHARAYLALLLFVLRSLLHAGGLRFEICVPHRKVHPQVKPGPSPPSAKRKSVPPASPFPPLDSNAPCLAFIQLQQQQQQPT